jgi:hypothetical protein
VRVSFVPEQGELCGEPFMYNKAFYNAFTVSAKFIGLLHIIRVESCIWDLVAR